jgi:ATP-dependent DNA helicase DinG
LSTLLRPRVPFEYRSKEEFPRRLAGWIGQVFYDILPEHGYEIREEQIFTAFQLAEAVCRRKVHFAEAGLGTGKTFAYLLTAVAFARFTGKPVVVACASTALQEQLVGPKGDIQTLSNLLNLNLDVRMAKDPRQYICDEKVNRLVDQPLVQLDTALEEVISWVEQTRLGERSEMPQVPDRLWAQIAWDETASCEACSARGFCKLVKVRENYRQARDLIVCDHGIFFDDLWTRDDRIADGKLPLLPDYSAAIIDEGHKVMLPAAMRAGRQVVKDDIDNMLSLLEQIQGARTSLVSITFAMRSAADRFFKMLYRALIRDERTRRLAVRIDDDLLNAADTLRRALEVLYRELQCEQELHLDSLSSNRLQAFEAVIERTTAALAGFYRNGGRDTIVWVDRVDRSFWVVPRDLSGLLRKRLFDKKIPVVFSSATLSNGGDFSYFARTLGVDEPSGSTVGSSFDFEKQALIYLPRRFPPGAEETWFPLALQHLAALLELTGGRALVLVNAPSDVRRIRQGLKEYQFPFKLLWEDQAERGYLVRRFREEVSSVLVGSGFWEGIDVPGPALSLLVIWRLPFPPRDPLIEARRREAKDKGFDPVTAVDYPEMGLRLKQGCGRLIRKSDDRGVIAILEPVWGMPWEQIVRDALPAGAGVVDSLDSLTGFLTT